MRYFGIGLIFFNVFSAFVNPVISPAKGILAGKIVEKETQVPMPDANVVLFNANDHSQVTGTTTDEDGEFQFIDLPNGVYYVQVDFIGFKTLKTPIIRIENNTETIDLGKIEIDVSPIVLEGVEITAEKSMYQYSIDRKVYHPAKDLIGQSGSVSEVLQNIPGVSVDVDGQVSLRGNSNVTFFINGKPSLLMMKNSAAALQQMAANSIDRIEVMTNPSARFKPDGVGGIINIVLKKESRRGFNQTIISNAGNRERYNVNMTINYFPEKVNLFGSYGLRRTDNPRTSTDSRVKRTSLDDIQSYYDRNISSFVRPLSHIASMGLDYSIDDKNSLEISGNYYFQDSYHTQSFATTMSDEKRQTTSSFTTDRTNDEFEKEYEISANYKRSFDEEGHTLQFELNLSGYDEKEDNFYDEKYSIPAFTNALRHFLVRKGGHLSEFYAEYTHPINEDTEFEAGYVGEFLRDDIRYLGENQDLQQGNWIKDISKSNRFLFNQDIHALYLTFGRSIEKLSFLAGLRAEQALITSNLVTSTSKIPNNYFRLYPTLHLAYELNDKQQFQLNYSRRVNRADSDEHNPFAEYTDPRNAEAGNPKIKPEKVHSVEFGYHLRNEDFSFIPSFYYRYKF